MAVTADFKCYVSSVKIFPRAKRRRNSDERLTLTLKSVKEVKVSTIPLFLETACFFSILVHSPLLAIFAFQALPRDSSATSSPSSPSNGHSSEQSQSASTNPILEKFKLPSSEPLVQGENHYRLRFDQLVRHVIKVHAPFSFFQLNGHTQGFHPETQKLEPPSTAL